jgi:catechol 2,3-dioxygenase-like lactoylglutathione lyase family enzyme
MAVQCSVSMGEAAHRRREQPPQTLTQLNAIHEGDPDMTLKMSAVMLGVEDLNRSKTFYAEGLGCSIANDYPQFVSLDLGDGSSSLALYQREAAAQDAGVSPEGSGFRGVSFHYIVDSSDAVDEIMSQAMAAGGSIVKEAAKAKWGGYFGYFSDPDGYLWKIATPD